MAKRLHSDLDSDEDLEDNNTKDEGWAERPSVSFCTLVHVYSLPRPFSLGSSFSEQKEKVFENKTGKGHLKRGT